MDHTPPPFFKRGPAPLVEWVENGTAPGAVTATGRSMPGQSRPLCPYPTYAHYKGGDAADAASYECRAPQAASSAGR